jgi:hypothetical protein
MSCDHPWLSICGRDKWVLNSAPLAKTYDRCITSCEHAWLSTNHTEVCSNCGREKRILSLDSYNKWSAPLARTYDRKSRFSVKVEKLLGIHSGPPVHDDMWLLLKTCTLTTPDSIRKSIRHSKLNTKHYDCVRIFTDVFTEFRVAGYNTHDMKNYLEKCFAVVHRCWCRSQCVKESFFSYDFLLRYFLEQIASPLLVYLKPRTNKRRLRKYMNKLTVIQFPGVCKTYYQNFVTDRFQNV